MPVRRALERLRQHRRPLLLTLTLQRRGRKNPAGWISTDNALPARSDLVVRLQAYGGMNSVFDRLTAANVAKRKKRKLLAADVDGDGDMDVLGAAYTADDITWWESDCIP